MPASRQCDGAGEPTVGDHAGRRGQVPGGTRRGRLRQRPPVQRHHPVGLRPHTARTAPHRAPGPSRRRRWSAAPPGVAREDTACRLASLRASPRGPSVTPPAGTVRPGRVPPRRPGRTVGWPASGGPVADTDGWRLRRSYARHHLWRAAGPPPDLRPAGFPAPPPAPRLPRCRPDHTSTPPTAHERRYGHDVHHLRHANPAHHPRQSAG